ncbi:hypothetical protein A4A49_34304 [Nicotiana attenuata]|uniref:Uncharacterized protein n=1 Tax=Nicotiana attenuata TaxID=49451 RepID=A0A1J6K8W2_NICAT|nr:hypothetical protein A4A49_34304 [Nicotiana attenuata]
MYGVRWAMPSNVKSLLETWQLQKMARSQLAVWRRTPLCVLWTTWLERHRVCFEGRRQHVSRIKHDMFDKSVLLLQKKCCGNLEQ